MTEKQFRNKVTWFSFLFSFLVVWIHAYNVDLYSSGNPALGLANSVELWLGERVGQVAVPGFFMISGYLFYRDFSWGKLGEKWQRRIRSVLVPFILWNLLYYLAYVAASRLPWFTDILGKEQLPFSWALAVDAVLHYTYNPVFWYLYQLILLILLAPVLYPLLKNTWTRVVFLGLIWLTTALNLPFPVNGDALIYYGTAAAIALSRREWVEGQRLENEEHRAVAMSKRGNGLGDITSEKGNCQEGAVSEKSHPIRFGLILLCAAAASYYFGLRFRIVPLFILCRLLAVMGLWLAVPGERLPMAREFMQNNFFFYAVHFPFVRLFNKAGAVLFPSVPAVPLLLFLLMPFIILGIVTVLAGFLRRMTPLLWRVVNGGR